MIRLGTCINTGELLNENPKPTFPESTWVVVNLLLNQIMLLKRLLMIASQL